jgi:uncharacterized SAM-binding protein YcdF (DUF218 family)
MGKRGWIGLLLVFGGFIAFADKAGYMLVVDAPQPSDVIVVLAGETDKRPQRALQLLAKGYARRIVLDVPAEAKDFGFSEIELAQKYVEKFPEAASISICPSEGLSTKDESHDAEKCLRSETGNRVLLVTSDFHTRRALSVFRHELRGKSFSVAAARDDREFGEKWWKHRQWAKTCTYEWVRWLWWNAVDRWR